MSNIYRDVTLNQVSEQDIGKTIRVAGWVENIRDHGGVSFIDLRDMYAVMQIVIRDGKLLEGIRKEQTITVEGLIEKRDEETYNPKIPTGTIELDAKEVTVLGEDDRDGIFGVTDSNPLCILSGRCKRLHCSFQKIQRKILCTATGSAAVQTASDGIRI